MSTPTPITDTEITFTGTYTCTHHNDQMRTACPVCLVATLTAERDQLRAAIAEMPTCRCDRSTEQQCELSAKVATLTAERDELRARAEHAEAIVGKLQELHGCSQEMVVHWCEHAANRSLGLDQARSELTAEREKSERYRLATLKLDAELATERARLDAGTILLTVAGERVWHCGVDLRAAIDAAMKENEK